MYISDIIPEKNELPEDFFSRIYPEVKIHYPAEKFWFVRKFGKRFSFICGEKEEPGFNPSRKEIGDNLYIFFSMDNNKCNNDSIYNFYFDIYNKYYK